MNRVNQNLSDGVDITPYCGTSRPWIAGFIIHANHFLTNTEAHGFTHAFSRRKNTSEIADRIQIYRIFSPLFSVLVLTGSLCRAFS